MRDLPQPLIERGDFVRLKKPYRPSTSSFSENLRKRLKRIVWQDEVRGSQDYVWTGPDSIPLSYFDSVPDRDAPDCLKFTHGTIVEIVSRYPAAQRKLEEATIVQYGNVRDSDPVRNVSCHLYNPLTGLMYMGGHPTESGKPEFVDFHISDLVLIQKHNERWNVRNPIDLAEIYGEWGIDEAIYFDPNYDDN